MYKIFDFLISALNSKTLDFIKVRRQKSSFLGNVLGRKLVGKNGFIVDSISADSFCECSIQCFISLSFLVNIMGNVFQICMHI